MHRPVISIENVSKRYRLGEFDSASLGRNLSRRVHAWLSGNNSRGIREHADTAGGTASDSDYIWALRSVSLDIREGDIVGIIGKNGAGKSTLLKIISRITTPTEGRIKIRGRIGSLLEVGTGMHPEMTARENIYINGMIIGIKRQEINRLFDEIVDFSGCELFLDTPIKRFSTGMRVRLGFAVAAFLDTEILIVDEVLAVGDLQFQKKCMGKMEEIGSEGRTILFVSHNMATLKVFCNKGVELNSGRIVKTGPMDEIIKHYMDLNSDESSLTSHYKTESVPAVADKAELLEIFLADADGNHISRINVNQGFNIHIKWKLNIEVPFLRVCMEFIDAAGTVVLMTEDTDSTDLYGKPRKPGVYSQTVTVPALLLMPGIYTVTVFAGMPRVERILEENNIIQFEITENNTHLSSVTGEMRSGYISTPLKWEILFSDV